jgi:hypothetical protein
MAVRSLENQVQETKNEHEKVRDAAIKFSYFLKSTSITAYDDTMIAYIDMVIKEERQTVARAAPNNVEATKNEERLKSLERNRSQYAARIEIIESQMGSSNSQVLDEQGIEDLIEEICGLPGWSKALRDLRDMDEWSSAQSCREHEIRPKLQGCTGLVQCWLHEGQECSHRLGTCMERSPAALRPWCEERSGAGEHPDPSEGVQYAPKATTDRDSRPYGPLTRKTTSTRSKLAHLHVHIWQRISICYVKKYTISRIRYQGSLPKISFRVAFSAPPLSIRFTLRCVPHHTFQFQFLRVALLDVQVTAFSPYSDSSYPQIKTPFPISMQCVNVFPRSPLK